MRQRTSWIAGVAAALLATGPGSAQDGLYAETALGGGLAPHMLLNSTDNDWGTRCDKLINPAGLETGTECDTPPPPTAWSNESRGTLGVMAGLAVGYRRGPLRVEAEYHFRSAAYHDYSPTVIGDIVTLGKADQELEIAIGGVGDVRAHNLFANVLYDFLHGSRVVPYIGAGVGGGYMFLDYFSLWKRNGDPSRIATFEDPLLRAKLAGTTTLGAAVLEDGVLGVQGIAGVDCGVGDRLTVGLKVRRTAFKAFKSGEREWDQLRSHASTVGRGSRIVYVVETPDTGAYGVTLNMRYRF